jgi:hypothetical protein
VGDGGGLTPVKSGPADASEEDDSMESADDKFLAAMRSGKRRFMARFANRDAPCGSKPDWSSPKEVLLTVLIRAAAYKKHPAGEILTVTCSEAPWGDFEAGERDYCPEFSEFMVEEYRMQLLDVL